MRKIWPIVVAVAIIIGAIAGILAIANDWDTVERFLDWIYPQPLLILLTFAAVAFAGLYARERRRKAPKSYKQVSEEQKRARAEQEAEARQAVILIRNEIASNRRLVETGLERGGMQLRSSDEAWNTYSPVLARLPDAGGALAVAQEAHDAFAHLDSADLGIGISPAEAEFKAAIEKARTAEKDLDSLAFWIEGTRARWQVGGMFESDG